MNQSLTILSYFIIWPIIMFGSAFSFYLVPISKFNPKFFLFKQRLFENEGLFYEKYLLIKKWKKLLPDGSALFKKGFRKKKLNSFSKEYLEEFVFESCRAEASHFPPIFLSLIFSFYNDWGVVFIMFIFALATNLPCIITQRYNRIRLLKILKKK